MDAITRHDLVLLPLPPGRVAAESFGVPTVSMSIKPKGRIGTGDPQENVEVFDLDYPRAGDDGQFRLFNYEYHSRGTPSETPRSEECALDLTLKFQGLGMEDSDEEQEMDNYTFSPTFLTASNLGMRAESVPLLASGLSCSVEAKYPPEPSENSSKVNLKSPSVEDTAARNPAFQGSNISTRLDHIQKSFELREKAEALSANNEKSDEKLQHERLQTDLGAHVAVEGSTDSATRSDHYSDEKCSEWELQKERHITTSRRAAMPSKEKNFMSHEEDITAGLCKPCLDPRNAVQPLLPAADALTVVIKSTAEATTSLEFDLAAHSIFGAGSWIENDTHDLPTLDVEGLGEFSSTDNESAASKNQRRKVASTTCHGNSDAGSTPQKDSGASSSESGSRETRQPQPNGGGNSKHPSSGSNGPGEDDDPIQSKKAKTENGTHKRFVCPFNFHDPGYFRRTLEHGEKFALCATGKGFRDVARVKEHLRRVHSPEISCYRCGSTFEGHPDLELHLNLGNDEGPACIVRRLPALRSMTPEMMSQLAIRGKRLSSLSEEEKWFKIYQMLFPDDPKPSTRPYRHDFDQPLPPSPDRLPNILPCESDLPRLLERRVEPQLGRLVSDPNCREQIMKIVKSELVFCMNQASFDYAETAITFDDSHVQKHRQSAVSSIDSAYGSRCGHTDCMGNCSASAQLVSPTSQSQGNAQPFRSPVFDPVKQYLEPSFFSDPQSTENQQWIEDMDDLRDYNCSGPYSESPYLDDSGTT